ncbi:MAG: nitric oxide reductase activation protein, partial [Gammaproteobacteria bacterium]|nr:nitric oxide reductase activation protein [Gammaproteobacteria bacterium]
MSRQALNEKAIIEFLDEVLEVEFSFVKNEKPAADIVSQHRPIQDFILNLTRRVAATNIELAYQFACHSNRALQSMELKMVEAWAMSATDQYDKLGLYPAMTVIKNLDQFIDNAHAQQFGAVLEEEASILLPFLQGLAGRKLKLAEAEQAYTDTETIFIPSITALFESKKENFLHYKVTVAYLWAQIQFGSFRVDLELLAGDKDTLDKFCVLENIRLEACIERELPGLYRDMQILKNRLHPEHELHTQNLLSIDAIQALQDEKARARHSLEIIEKLELEQWPETYCYQGTVQLEQVSSTLQKRVEKEKAYFRVALSELAKEHSKKTDEDTSIESND